MKSKKKNYNQMVKRKGQEARDRLTQNKAVEHEKGKMYIVVHKVECFCGHFATAYLNANNSNQIIGEVVCVHCGRRL